MSGGRYTGYFDIDNTGPVAKVHIPPCQHDQKTCRNRLSELEQKLQEIGIDCHHVYPLGGTYKDDYEKFVEESQFTILHKCPSFWWKYRNCPSANCRTAPKGKLICVSLGSRESIHNEFIRRQFHNESTRQSYEAFFQDLNVIDISNASSLNDFVCNLAMNLSNTRIVATDKARIISGGQWREPGGYAPAAQRKSSYPGYPSSFDFPQSPDLFCESLQYTFIGEGQILEPVPDIFGHTNPGSYVFARADCLAVDEQPVFSKNTSFDKLKEQIASWKKSTDQRTVQRNVQRMLHKDIPDLFDKRDSVRLAHLAVCQHPEIQDRALTFLELLLLQGHLEGTVTMTAEFFIDILDEMSKQANNMNVDIERISIILIMLHSEAALSFQEEGDVYANFNKSVRNKMKERLTHIDQRLSDVYGVFQKCAKSNGKDILPFRYDNFAYDEDSLYQYAKTFLDKSISTQAISIYEQLKKIFSLMRVRDASVLEKLVSLDSSPRKRSPLSATKKLHGICKTLIFNGLVLFLQHGLRSAGQRDINPMCEKVFGILKVIAEKKIIPINKVRHMLEPLLYDHTPAIRQDVLQILSKTGMDKSYSPAIHNAEEIKRLLCPLLQTDAIELSEGDENWCTFRGKFADQPVVVFEGVYNDMAPIPRGHDRQLQTLLALEHPHIMKLFAYQIHYEPRFYITENYMSDNFQDALKNGNKNHRYLKQSTLTRYQFIAAEALEYCHNAGIVHRNITAASFFLATEKAQKLGSAPKKTLKLGGFQLAKDLEKNDTDSADDLKLPVRWCAPESLKPHQPHFSKASDRWMFGVLMYEVSTHGALPYSDTNISDAELVKQLTQTGQPRLCHEECIRDDHYELISQCCSVDPSKRPELSVIKDKLKEIYLEVKSSTVKPNYPPLDDSPSSRLSFTERKMGKYYKAWASNSPEFDHSTAKKIQHFSPALTLYSQGDGFIFREDVSRTMPLSYDEVKKMANVSGSIPGLQIIFSESKTSLFTDYYIKSKLVAPFASHIDGRPPDKSLESDFELLSQVALAINDLHKKCYVLGHVDASHLVVVKDERQTVQIHIVSYAYLNVEKYTGNPEAKSRKRRNLDGFVIQRAAPEVVRGGAFSPASDVYNFGYLLWEVLAALLDKQPIPMKEGFTNEELSKLQVKAGQALGPPICNLIRSCIKNDKAKRPTMTHIVEEIQRVIQKQSTIYSLATNAMGDGGPIVNVDMDEDGYVIPGDIPEDYWTVAEKTPAQKEISEDATSSPVYHDGYDGILFNANGTDTGGYIAIVNEPDSLYQNVPPKLPPRPLSKCGEEGTRKESNRRVDATSTNTRVHEDFKNKLNLQPEPVTEINAEESVKNDKSVRPKSEYTDATSMKRDSHAGNMNSSHTQKRRSKTDDDHNNVDGDSDVNEETDSDIDDHDETACKWPYYCDDSTDSGCSSNYEYACESSLSFSKKKKVQADVDGTQMHQKLQKSHEKLPYLPDNDSFIYQPPDCHQAARHQVQHNLGNQQSDRFPPRAHVRYPSRPPSYNSSNGTSQGFYNMHCGIPGCMCRTVHPLHGYVQRDLGAMPPLGCTMPIHPQQGYICHPHLPGYPYPHTPVQRPVPTFVPPHGAIPPHDRNNNLLDGTAHKNQEKPGKIYYTCV